MAGKLPEYWYQVARFWDRVEGLRYVGGCWTWTGKTDTKGYGITTLRGVEIKAHRFAYIIANGLDELPETECVRHQCHNPSCVNPRHLLLGDRKDNAEDDRAAGKILTGANRWSSKFSDEQIAIALDRSIPASKAAKLVGCSLSYVYTLRSSPRLDQRTPGRSAYPKRNAKAGAARAMDRG